MPGRMAPLKKPRSTTKLPLALNPLKSKDVLAVLAERNQAVVPVGAWVEPASPNSSEIPASTSAYIIEEELKEQLRKKQEALKHFQRQVKHRVNQQIRLKKKQQLQKSLEAAEKEGSIAMQSSDPARLTPKRTSVFPSNLNAAIGSSRLPSFQLLEDAIEDGENQNELFQQQAQALSQTMKEARHRLASHKTEALSRKPACIKINLETKGEFPLKIHQGLLTTTDNQNFMDNQEDDYEDASSIIREDKGRIDLFEGTTHDIFSEDKDKPFSRVQKVKFKNPLFVVMEEEEPKQSSFQGLQDIPPKAQDCLPEAQYDLPETQADLIEVQSAEPEVQSAEPDTQAIDVEVQAVEPEVQAVKTETQGIMLKAQSFELEDGNIELEAQDFLPPNQTLLLKDQDVLSKPQDQDSLPEGHCVLPKEQQILLKCQDQNFLPEDQDFLPKDQCVLPKDQNILPKSQDQDLLPKDQCVLRKDHNAIHKCQELHFQPKDQEKYFWQPSSALTTERWKKEWPTNTEPCLLHRFQDQTSIRDQLEQKEEGDQQEKANLKQSASILIGRRGRGASSGCPSGSSMQALPGLHQQQVCFKEPFSDVTDEKGREDFPLVGSQYLLPKSQFQDFIREQVEQKKKENIFLKQPSCFMREERVREEMPLEYHQYGPPKIQDHAYAREQHRNYGQAAHDMSDERWRKKFFPECHGRDLHEVQDLASAREQSLYFREQPSVGTAERWREVLLLDGHQHLPPRNQRQTCSRRQVYDEHQSRLRTEFQIPLAFQSGVDKEEDKKERQKQYLRHRRLFMDIEREQVKEQKRQKEQKKRIEKIKKKKEQQRYAEEQRILRMNINEEPYSGEKMSDILAQLQLEELKGIREKQQQREKEHIRYVEALRAQVQEKMRLYNITLPPLCCCGPDFWDAHPDTCANNCIFYKNHKAYNRALHSVINSSDISKGNATLRSAIRNFASAHRQTLKNLY